MPLKQGTETITDILIFILLCHKKDAPKAGDGNICLNSADNLSVFTDKKDAPKAGDGNKILANG